MTHCRRTRPFLLRSIFPLVGALVFLAGTATVMAQGGYGGSYDFENVPQAGQEAGGAPTATPTPLATPTPTPSFRLRITAGSGIIPFDLRKGNRASVPVTVWAEGRAPAGVRVVLDIREAASVPFLSLPAASVSGFPLGSAVTLTVATPTPDLDFLSLPLEVTFRARAYDPLGTFLAGTTLKVPLNVAIVTGTTLGPDMKPRAQPVAPWLVRGNMIASQLQPGKPARFTILVQPPADLSKAMLRWGPQAILPLQLPVSAIPWSGTIGAPVRGAHIDLGGIDVLSPAEHEARIKGWVEEMLRGLGWNNGNLGQAIARLRGLPFNYSVSGISVPLYTRGITNATGEVRIPLAAKDYWGVQAFLPGEDPPYAIFLHELGHFVHQQMVESWLQVCIIDKRFNGGPHTTWRPPDAWTEKGKQMTSFFENTADFFASLAFDFIQTRHPEITRSIFFNRGYLAEFDSGGKADAAAAAYGGCRVEGVETTYLRQLYGASVHTRPARVFGDYLRVMNAKKADSWIFRWVPARNISEWIALKGRPLGMQPAIPLTDLARRYQMFSCENTFLLYPATASTPAEIAINHESHTLNGRRLGEPVAPGDTVLVTKGSIVLQINQVTGGRPAAVAASRGASFEIVSPTLIVLYNGSIAVDGPIAVENRQVTLAPSGTSFAARVEPGGGLRAQVIEGQVTVSGPAGTSHLAEGEAATIDGSGRLTPVPVEPVQLLVRSFVGETVERHDFSVPPPLATVTPTPPPSQPAALRYLLVKEKASGRLVIVAGEQGVSPGDRILGIYRSLAEASAARSRVVPQAPLRAAPPPTPTPAPLPPVAPPPEPTPVRPTPPPGTPELINPAAVTAVGPGQVLVVGSDWGNARLLRATDGRPGVAVLVPRNLRHLSLEKPRLSGLCPILQKGRRWGSILVFSPRRGDGMVIRNLDGGRPRSSRINFVPTLTVKGGGVAVAPRNGQKGETSAVYLYHWPTGTALYAPRFFNGGPGIRGAKVPRFPATASRPAIVQVTAHGFATRSYVIIDPASGGVWCVLNVRPRPARPRVVETAVDLPRSLGSGSGGPHDIVAAALYRAGGASSRALVADGRTGRLAVLEHDDDPARIRAAPVSPGLDAALPAGPTPRRLAAWPGPSPGSVWILDRSSGRLISVAVPGQPSASGIFEAAITPVAVTVE
ncbi:MAG: hypothetical protein GXP48_05240 [Acidobacteria bacterium]|nr:hypothetical protein [Acidobacteriota bacterium]